jgi:hypothetical protein
VVTAQDHLDHLGRAAVGALLRPRPLEPAPPTPRAGGAARAGGGVAGGEGGGGDAGAALGGGGGGAELGEADAGGVRRDGGRAEAAEEEADAGADPAGRGGRLWCGAGGGDRRIVGRRDRMIPRFSRRCRCVMF